MLRTAQLGKGSTAELLGSVDPRCLGGGWNETHGTFRQRGNRQAGIDAKVGGDDGTIADVHILVAEYAVMAIDDALGWGIGNDASPETVGGAWDVEENLREHTQGGSSGHARELLRELVGAGNVGGNLVSAAD